MKYAFSLLLGLGVLLSGAAQAAPGSGELTLQNNPAMTQKVDWYRPWYRHHHRDWYHHHHWGYRRYHDYRW